jgi:hypothetical protein
VESQVLGRGEGNPRNGRDKEGRLSLYGHPTTTGDVKGALIKILRVRSPDGSPASPLGPISAGTEPIQRVVEMHEKRWYSIDNLTGQSNRQPLLSRPEAVHCQ